MELYGYFYTYYLMYTNDEEKSRKIIIFSKHFKTNYNELIIMRFKIF